jgi:hypothetical protein
MASPSAALMGIDAEKKTAPRKNRLWLHPSSATQQMASQSSWSIWNAPLAFFTVACDDAAAPSPAFLAPVKKAITFTWIKGEGQSWWFDMHTNMDIVLNQVV